MIKTFVWNTEYDVYIANSDTVERARWLILQKFIEDKKEYMIEGKDKEDILKLKFSTGTVPSYVHARAVSVLDNDLRDFVQVFTKEPDIVIEDKQAVIYKHANE